MHLLAPLAAGIKGAESGTASIFTRGTTTRATYFTDFEGNSSVTSGDDVNLDTNGGEQIYVNSFVRVVVKKDGTTIRTFTDGAAASAVELRSQSFLGTDYDSGASAASNPISLKEAMDLWLTSAGTTDFNILKDGASSTLQAALGATIFYNVVDYGATGDGTTDDTSAIQAAENAAGIAGGVVFFPGGTYRITTTLTLSTDSVSLIGADSAASIIKIDNASNADAVTFLGANGRDVRGLGFTCAQANSGSFISGGGTGHTTIDECTFDGTNMTGSLIVMDSSAALTRHVINNCDFQSLPTAVACVTGLMTDTTLNSFFSVSNCRFSMPELLHATTGYAIAISAGMVYGNEFACADMTLSAALILVNQASRAQSNVTCYGNTASRSAGGSPTMFRLNPEELSLQEGFTEIGNICMLAGGFGTNTPTGETSINTWASGSAFMSRQGMVKRTSHSSGVLTLDVSDAEFQLVQQTDASAFTLNMTLMPIGNRVTLMVMNTHSGTSGIITFGANIAEHDTMTTTSFNLLQDENQSWEFISLPVRLSDSSDAHRWVMLSDSTEGGYVV